MGGGKRGLSQKCFNLNEPPPLTRAAVRRDTKETQSGFILFTHWIRCKRVHPFDASQQPARWEGQRLQSEAKGNKTKKTGHPNLAAGPGAVMSLAS